MKLTWIATGLLAGFGVAGTPATSEAGTSFGIRIVSGHQSFRGHRPYYADTGRIGYNRGFDHGLNQGAKDWRKQRRFDLWRHRRYRKADSGYRSRYGPRQLYRSGYRAGYQQGYRRAYGGYRGHDPYYDGKRGYDPYGYAEGREGPGFDKPWPRRRRRY